MCVRARVRACVIVSGVGIVSLPRARRSKGVIWFGEGSPKEGDRIIAWYKSELELGLSWGFTGRDPGP